MKESIFKFVKENKFVSIVIACWLIILVIVFVALLKNSLKKEPHQDKTDDKLTNRQIELLLNSPDYDAKYYPEESVADIKNKMNVSDKNSTGVKGDKKLTNEEIVQLLNEH